jgi:hypothetical protein
MTFVSNKPLNIHIMKTLIIILVASFLISANLLSQDYAMNKDMTNLSDMSKNNLIYSKKDAVIMQRMTTLDRTENWNKLFNNPPKNGFIVFDTDENDYFFFNGKAWEHVMDVKRDINGKIINEKSVAVNN